MTWVKLDDGFFRNPKTIAAGPQATLLYLAGLCYCQAGLTDGVIASDAMGLLAAEARVPDWEPIADRLVAIGLWERRSGGYQVHDYLEYNPPAEQVKRDREAAAERMRRLRSGEPPANNSPRSPEVRPNISRSSPSPAHSRPSPTPPPVQAPAGDEDDAPAAPSAAASEPDSRRLVGDLLVGKPGFRESAEFWAALDGLDGRIPLRLEVLKALDWLRDKRKPKVTARFVLGWLERAAKDVPPPPADAPNGSVGPPDPPPVSQPVVAWPGGQPAEPEAAQLWTATLGVLAGQMNRGNFGAYFRDTRGLALDNGHLVVGVKNPYVLDQLGRQFGHLMRRTLEDIPGAPPDVRLVVGP
jgi:hypothetical protein